MRIVKAAAMQLSPVLYSRTVQYRSLLIERGYEEFTGRLEQILGHQPSTHFGQFARNEVTAGAVESDGKLDRVIAKAAKT